MSQHITSIASSSIPRLDPAAFTAKAETGMLLFAAHKTGLKDPVDDVIDAVTKSCLTHVAMVYQEPITGKHLVLESRFPYGARMGRFDYYVSQYEGDLVLASIPGLFIQYTQGQNLIGQTTVALDQALQTLLTQLDQPYDVEVEIQMLMKKLIHIVKPESGLADHTCECAEYMGNGLNAAGYTVPQPSTPELLWCLDFVNPLYALVKG